MRSWAQRVARRCVSGLSPGRRRPTAVARVAGLTAALAASALVASVGAAATAARHVINDWLKALRSGNVKRAAHYFALPSKFQNATPVLTVHNEQERIAVNVSLSCGAVATQMGGAGVYTIVTFRLTERKGGNCGTGVGGKARGAIRVERRHIKEWYRLPDEPGGAQQAPSAPSGPSV